MFVKVNDTMIVNLLHVTEIEDTGSCMKVWTEDRSITVSEDHKQELLHRLHDMKRAIQRLAVGNF